MLHIDLNSARVEGGAGELGRAKQLHHRARKGAPQCWYTAGGLIQRGLCERAGRAKHCVGFAGAGLPIGHHVHVDAVEEGLQPRRHEGVVEGLLIHVGRDDVRRIVEVTVVDRHICSLGGESDCVIVNTCGFLDEARQEGVDTLLELEEMKKNGKIASIVVMGCMSERFGAELKKEFFHIDRFFDARLKPN